MSTYIYITVTCQKLHDVCKNTRDEMYNTDPQNIQVQSHKQFMHLVIDLRQNFDHYVHTVVTQVKIFRNSTKR